MWILKLTAVENVQQFSIMIVDRLSLITLNQSS